MRISSIMPGLALAVLLAACGAGAAEAEGPAGGGLSGELVVHAAASLTDAFADVREAFTAEHPDVTITYNFAGSQQLAQQLTSGAPGDVFASANQRQMDVAGEAGLLAGESRPFTANVLEIAVEPGNPLGIRGLGDLARPDVTVVLPAEDVPAGQYAREVLDGAGVAVQPASLETDVRAVLQRVTLGEADAGVVYASDVASAGGEVDGVAIPGDQNVPATYPIAILAHAPNAQAAEAFVDFVLSDEGQALLAEHGFTELP